MSNFLSPLATRSDKFYGQFVLTTSESSLPLGWPYKQQGQWKLAFNKLPVLEVRNLQNEFMGWCLGHPIINGVLAEDYVTFQCDNASVTDDQIDAFYYTASGKWLLLLVNIENPRVYLDAYGSISAVYSLKEQTIASTATLIQNGHQWNEALVKAMGLPQHDAFLVSGLTSKHDVARILPNHSLNIQSWKTERHWPRPDTDLSEDGNTDAAVEKITRNIQYTIAAVAAKHPLCFSLTAGMDSRMLLSCAKPYVDQAHFFTFTLSKGSVDDTISKLLAQRHQLNHDFYPTLTANELEAEQWLARTGYCMSGSIWKVHKSLYKLDPNRVLLPGTAGEIGRKILLWRLEDSLDSILTPQRIFDRYKIPDHPTVRKVTEEWLDGIRQWDLITQYYLVFIEQRLGCWAAPQHYGNNHSLFECSPFNSREIFHTSLRLPVAYRKEKRLPADMIRNTWPELLELPFNEYPGMKGAVNARYRKFKSFIKQMIVK